MVDSFRRRPSKKLHFHAWPSCEATFSETSLRPQGKIDLAIFALFFKPALCPPFNFELQLQRASCYQFGYRGCVELATVALLNLSCC